MRILPKVAHVGRIVSYGMVVAALGALGSQPAFAVPANKSNSVLLEQPGGAQLQARLRGDESSHWYVTELGHPILRDSEGVWRLAIAKADGEIQLGAIANEETPVSPSRVLPRPRSSKGQISREIHSRLDVTGTADIVVVLVEFSDTPAGEGSTGPHDAAYFEDPVSGRLFGSQQGTVADYFDEVSYGQLSIQGVVANGSWHQVIQTEGYWGSDCSPGTCIEGDDIDNCNACIYDLARDAVLAADSSGFDFSPYDADEDGEIDHVMIVHAGGNQAETLEAADIWSHNWEIPEGVLQVDGLDVRRYTMVAESDFLNVLAHEVANDLGIPDLFDHDLDSEPVGTWCNMGANLGTDQPPHICGFLKLDLDGNFGNGLTGWLAPSYIDAAGSYAIPQLDQNASGSVWLTDPAFSGQEHFVVENRQRTGYYDQTLPESGIIFTHVDMTVPLNDGPPTHEFHGAWVERPGDLAGTNSAAYSQEDDEVVFDLGTVPSTNDNQQVGTGLAFRNIGPEGPTMTFELRTSPTEKGGTITDSETWGLDESPFLIVSNLTVADGVTLDIEPGVVVKFNPGQTMTVQGALLAEGTPDSTIVFTSYRDDEHGGDTNTDGPSDGSPGDWRAMIFTGSDPGTTLAFCKVRYAGALFYVNNWGAAIGIDGTSSQLTMTNCIVERTYKHSNYSSAAIYARSGNPTLVFDNCVLRENEGSGVYFDSGSLDLTNSRFENNGNHGFYMADGGLGAFSHNVATGNGNYGYALRAEFVTSFWADSSNVGYEANGHEGALGVTGGSLATSTTWTDDQVYSVIHQDISIPDNVSLEIRPGSVLKFSSNRSLYVYGTLVSEGETTNSIVFTSYRDDEHGGDTNMDGPSDGLPGDWRAMIFTGSDPGTSLAFCKIRYAGALFYANNWGAAIGIDGTSSQLTMTNCIVERTYKHTSYSSAAIYARSGNPTLAFDNCVLRENEGSGVYFDSGSLNLTNSRFENNGNHGFYMADGGLGAFSHNVATGNGNYGYALRTESVTSFWADSSNVGYESNGHENALGVTGGSLTTSTTWTDDQVYSLIHHDVSIPDNVTLDLEPGSILKMWGRSVRVYGTMIADGSSSDPIVFTSYRDDAFGGDTNMDGMSSGLAGDWGLCDFSSADSGCVMNYVHLLHGGSDTHGVLWLRGSMDFSMLNSTVEGNRYGATLDADGSVTISNSTFKDNTYTGPRVAGVGPFQMTNCEVSGHGGTGATTTRAGSVFEYCEFNANGGFGFHSSALGVSVDSCAAVANDGNGFMASANGTIARSGSDNNGGYGFQVVPNMVGPILETCTFSDNGWSNSIGVYGGDLTDDSVWTDNLYVIHGDIEVEEDARLFLEPGTIFKFFGAYVLRVKGSLHAWGTDAEKVIFTSYHDDNFGGDTNENGIQTTGEPGNWKGLDFPDSRADTDMRWCLVSYAGSGGHPAIQLRNGSVLDLDCCLFLDNGGWGLTCDATSELKIQQSDIVGNLAGGVSSANVGFPADAEYCWWGDISGPSGSGPGTGDAVSDNVLYGNWLNQSKDNPWRDLDSPSESGNYTDLVFFDLFETDFPDLAATTEESGIEVYQRTGMESWSSVGSPLPTGQYSAIDAGDFNDDNHDDLVVGGPDGIHCFGGDGAGVLTEVTQPLTGSECSDLCFTRVNHDSHQDIIAASSDGEGIWTFYGDGLGNWTPGNRPTTEGSFNRIDCVDLDEDSWIDIVATTVDANGVQIWYGSETGEWSQAAPISDGFSYFGLDVGYVDSDSLLDIAVGANEAGIGIKIFLNTGGRGWSQLDGPVAVGIYNDVVLRDLNGDGRTDLAAASQGSGIGVWLGTSNLFWNYWYHPETSHIFKSLFVNDFTLNSTPDLAGASLTQGIHLWDNQSSGVFDEYLSLDPSDIDFGQVVVGACDYRTFEITNISPTSVDDIVVYPSSTSFQVSSGGRDVGPFSLDPGESRVINVAFCPLDVVDEAETIIVHADSTVTNLPVYGEGVPYIPPVWSVNILVENSVGGTGESQDLVFGAGVGATDSLDVQAGESCLPPSPPSDVFDARFQIVGCDGSLTNIHDNTRIEDTFVLEWQAGSAGYPVTVSWDPQSLPSGTFLIGTPLADTLDMAVESEYVLPPGSESITELYILTNVYSRFTHDLDGGWQLASLPIVNDADSVAVLFPGATSAFGFDGTTYFQAQVMDRCQGYWLNMPADVSVDHIGEQLMTCEVSMTAGWNLVGMVYDDILAGDVVESPGGCVLSIYGFGDAGYHLVGDSDFLIPGRGYWMNASEDCDIIIDGTGSRPGSRTQAEPQAVVAGSDWEMELRLIGESAEESWTRSVFLGTSESATDGIDRQLGEHAAPPRPPRMIPDLRLANERYETYRDIRPLTRESSSYEVTWQMGNESSSASLKWESSEFPEGSTAMLSFRENDGELVVVDMAQTDQVRLTVPVGELRIELGIPTGESLPSTLALHQGVPNPFQKGTSLRFDLPRDGEASLVVVDVAGRQVRTLVSGPLGAGRHEASWDGKDDRGQQLPAGTYFFMLEVGRDRLVNKGVFLR